MWILKGLKKPSMPVLPNWGLVMKSALPDVGKSLIDFIIRVIKTMNKTIRLLFGQPKKRFGELRRRNSNHQTCEVLASDEKKKYLFCVTAASAACNPTTRETIQPF